MSNTQPINTQPQAKQATGDMLRQVKQWARTSTALVTVMQGLADTTPKTDKQEKTFVKACEAIGAKMLANKNALSRSPSELRMQIEAIKQKVTGLVASLDTSKTLEAVSCKAVIAKYANVASVACAVFIAEYNEHKQAQAKAA